MKKYYSKILFVIILAIILLPKVSFAAGLIPCDGVTVPCDFKAFAQLINGIINWFLGISVSVAAITFAYAGAQMLFNPDEPKKLEDAKAMFKKTIIGMIIILGAWLIINTIVGALVNESTNALRFLKG